MGKAIQTRIKNWDSSIIAGWPDKNKKDHIIEIAKNYIEPLDYETKELDKLVDYITRHINASV
jgi:archaellum component FlaC